MADRAKAQSYSTFSPEERLPSTDGSSSGRTDSSGGHSSSGDMRLHDQKDAQGYDLEFVPPADKKYECPICLLVLREPVQTICGHRYCKQCLNKWVRDKTTPYTCPACNTVLDGPYFPDNCAKREILSLTIQCPNTHCETLLELRDLKKHTDQCDYTEIPCPNDCMEYLLRQDMDAHLSNDCRRRKLPCTYCKTEVYLDAMQDHSAACPDMNSPCQFCALDIPRREHLDHAATSCLQAPTQCFYRHFGCREQVVRSDLDKHYTSSVYHHLQLLSTHVLSLTSGNVLYDIRDPRTHNDPPVRDATQQSYDSQGSTTTSGFYSTSNMVQASNSAARLPQLTTQLGGNNGHDYFHHRFAQDSLPYSDPLMDTRTHLKTLPERILFTPPRTRKNGEPDERDETIARLHEEVRGLNNKVAAQALKASRSEAMIRELSNSISDYEGRSCNGSYLWKIKTYSQRRQDAINGASTVIHSPGFYSSFYGYKLCMRVNLNGVESGQGTHISLFVHFMRGEFDDVVEWPFEGKITISILDQNENAKQRRHIVENLYSKPNLAAFQRPLSNRNHKGFGYLEYAPIAQLEQNHFIKNETLIIKAEIHPGA